MSVDTNSYYSLITNSGEIINKLVTSNPTLEASKPY